MNNLAQQSSQSQVAAAIPAAAAGESAVHEAGALLGTGAVVVWNDVVDEGRRQFYQWHDKEHIPERLSIPGFRRGRRYRRSDGSPEWLTLYEADDLAVVTSPDYLARLNAPSPLTQSTLKFFRNTSRAVCRIVHSVGASTGGHIVALRLSVPHEHAGTFVGHMMRNGFPRAMASTGVVACHLFAADQAASFVDTAESKTRAFDVPSWVVLCEATTADAVNEGRLLIEADALGRIGVEVRPDSGAYSLEICRLATWSQTPA